MALFGGGTAKEGKELERQAASRYTEMAQQLMGPAAEQRNQTADYYSGIIKGGPEASRVTAPEVADLKRQYAVTSKQISDKLPAGGEQQRARMRLLSGMPGAISSVRQKKVEDALRALTQISQANTSNVMAANQGVQGSARTFMDLSEKEGARWNGLLGFLGNTLGQQAIGGVFSPKQSTVSYPNNGKITTVPGSEWL